MALEHIDMSRFDELATAWQSAQEVPALSVAVLRRGVMLHAVGYGGATVESTFQTASVGKHFTAALVLLLAASGELPPLDEAISRVLSEMPVSWDGITLRHLLSHTAGIPAVGYDSLELSTDYTDAEIVRAIASGGELSFRPGDAWEYSNAGYVLVGLIIGRITGRFYGDLLRDRIFLPLGMATADVTAPGAAPGYCREGSSLVPASFVSPTLNRLADGGLSLSVLDFARWEKALCGDWEHRLAEMFVETRLASGAGCGYGLGWFLSDTPRGRVARHAGGWQGFSTAMVRYLDEGVSAVVLSNFDDADATGLAHALVAAV
jgi:CubicO group peptidase (beta-lactamase class C family)